MKLLMVLSFLLGFLPAHEVVVNTLDGEAFVFDIDDCDNMSSLRDRVAALHKGKPSTMLLEFVDSDASPIVSLEIASHHGQNLGYPRNYYAEVTENERDNIRYIITTLANDSLISVWTKEDSLNAAGGEVDHLHPLRFFLTVFQDEEMKVGIRNIRGRGIIWGRFVKGHGKSFSTEANDWDNMNDTLVRDFADKLGIDAGLILPATHAHDWEHFLDLLIQHVPRKGNHDRYDM